MLASHSSADDSLRSASSQRYHHQRIIAAVKYFLMLFVLIGASSAVRGQDFPDGSESDEDSFPKYPAGEFFSDSTFSFDAGVSIVNFSGGLKNIFEPNDITAPANFSVSNASGFHVALSVAKPLSSWLAAAVRIRFMQVTASYSLVSATYLDWDPASQSYVESSFSCTATTTYDALSFDPELRMNLVGNEYFEIGGSVGYVIAQSGTYNHTITGAGARQTNISSTFIGTPAPQWGVQAGVGGVIAGSQNIAINFALRARVALTPLFSDNFPRVAFSADPTIGIIYRVQ